MISIKSPWYIGLQITLSLFSLVIVGCVLYTWVGLWVSLTIVVATELLLCEYRFKLITRLPWFHRTIHFANKSRLPCHYEPFFPTEYTTGVIMLHGIFSGPSLLNELGTYLQAAFPSIAFVSLRYHHTLQDVGQPFYTQTTKVEEEVKLIKAMYSNVQRWIYIGSSFGGPIARYVANKDCDAIGFVSICAPHLGALHRPGLHATLDACVTRLSHLPYFREFHQLTNQMYIRVEQSPTLWMAALAPRPASPVRPLTGLLIAVSGDHLVAQDSALICRDPGKPYAMGLVPVFAKYRYPHMNVKRVVLDLVHPRFPGNRHASANYDPVMFDHVAQWIKRHDCIALPLMSNPIEGRPY